MDNKKTFTRMFLVASAIALAAAQEMPSRVDLVHRIDGMNDAQRVALTKSLLDQGVPDARAVGDLRILVGGRSSLILPMLEAKIEEVLRSMPPRDRVAEGKVDPNQIVEYLRFLIGNTGDEQALREVAKLIKIDEGKFDGMVYLTMTAAMSSDRNPFTLAYQGFDIGDPAIDKRLGAWADQYLNEELPKVGNPAYEKVRGRRHEWADALLERYGGAPTAEQWTNDPLASRLKPELAGKLYNDVYRFAVTAAKKRSHK